MANQEHLDILQRGTDAWNDWRAKNPGIRPYLDSEFINRHEFERTDLSGRNLFRINLQGSRLLGADLSEANLSKANLSEANLRLVLLSRSFLDGAKLNSADLTGADLSSAILISASLENTKLWGADLSGAHLRGANLQGSDLSHAYLSGADLIGANLSGADLSGADLSSADLTGADLSRATLVGTNLTGATLTQCSIYGISVWNVQLEGAKQDSLIITSYKEPEISVDDLEVAQFIYLLLKNERIRHVIDTITSKVVLILGRFTQPRMQVLDGIRDALRNYGYLPILFDFDKPESRDTFETISTLARLSRFVIADITNPKSIPGELVEIVPNLPSLPVQPLLRYGSKPWGMYDHIKRYPWVLEIHRYRNSTDLLSALYEKVIEPAEKKAQELAKR